ncbi:MAG: hypothetical protein QGI86_16810 [Candidatus Poribacteria bacterium]|jgi:hypothetical protein|nr:hypothetical protein [Candidatus Poribacteria bacterium]MDP6745647.1 hypothetical protein [Candidatus Poribacteria bacterium]MDP6997421.1 hypothetical protein [Candidatus Poribacteria bacterium]
MFLLLLAVSQWAVEYVVPVAVVADNEIKAKAGKRNSKNTS